MEQEDGEEEGPGKAQPLEGEPVVPPANGPAAEPSNGKEKDKQGGRLMEKETRATGKIRASDHREHCKSPQKQGYASMANTIAKSRPPGLTQMPCKANWPPAVC